jgi:hypothetical protein
LIDVDAEGFLVCVHPTLPGTCTKPCALQFQDKYITRKAQGGEALADELLIRTREYLRPQFEDADSLDIIVRVYANLEGMANYLVRLDKVRNLGSLRAMATGFCGRISSFDWIDVGVGKEGNSGRKIRGTSARNLSQPLWVSNTRAENLSFYTSNSHLRHVIVGCSPVDLPASLLSALPLDKLTLIESVPLPAALTTLPLKVVKFTTLFPPPPPVSKPQRLKDRNGGPQLQLMQQEDDSGGSTWLVIQPERSKSQHRGQSRRGQSEDEASNLSISIGPDNTVSVDSGRRRRIMG